MVAFAAWALGLQPHQFTVPDVAEPPLSAVVPPLEHAAAVAAVTPATTRTMR